MERGGENTDMQGETKNGVRRREKRKTKHAKLRGLRLMHSDNRGLLEETWTTGSNRESRDCQEKTTASCKGKEKKKQAETRLNISRLCVSVPVPVTLSRKRLRDLLSGRDIHACNGVAQAQAM